MLIAIYFKLVFLEDISLGFKEHGVMLYLSKELYTGFIKLQSDKGLGRAYAGLLPFTEGLFKLNYITKEVYEKHIAKYSKPLVDDTPTLSSEQKQEKQLLEKMDDYFKNVLIQCDEHDSEDWQKKVFQRAEQYDDKLNSARLVLKKRVV